MLQAELLTRGSISLLKIAYALLMRISGPTLELGKFRSLNPCPSGPPDDFGLVKLCDQARSYIRHQDTTAVAVELGGANCNVTNSKIGADISCHTACKS